MKIVKIIFILILSAAAVLSLLQPWKQSTREPKNPYEFNIDDYKNVQPDLIKWQEVQQLTIDLTTLRAVAVGSDNKIYVTGDSTLLVLNKDGEEIYRVELSEPAHGIAIAPDNRIFLGMVDHVQIYEPDAVKSATWPRLNDQALITSIAVTEDDVYLADAGNKLVHRYHRSGELLGHIGARDSTREIPGFVVPGPYFDLAIGFEGFLWVTNPGRLMLENYTPDGDLRSSWGQSGMAIEGFCGCCNPTHIAIFPDGSFVTSEKGLPRVKIYDQMGKFKQVVAGPEHFAEGTVGLDLALDPTRRILVLDPIAKVVRIFTRKVGA